MGIDVRRATPFAQVAPGDLYVPIVGQLPPPNYSLRDEFEPGPVEAGGFRGSVPALGPLEAGFGKRARKPHHTLIFAEPDTELDDRDWLYRIGPISRLVGWDQR